MAPGASPPLRELLKRYRAAAGLTQEELAERAGISARAISDLERGLKQRPHAYTLGRLVQALGLEDEDRAAFDAAARPGASAGGMDEVPLNQTLTRHLATVHTFLVADMRDYTRYTNEHGDDAAAVLADRFAVICRDVVSAGGGEVIELRGDEALAVFGSPRQALRTAVVLQDRFARETECDPRLPLRVGIGLDVGEAVPVQGGYRGGALNLAARLCGIAGAGEVLCSEGVVALARKTAGIVMADRGEVRLKGLSSPVRVIQIAREGELPPDLPPLQPIDHPTNLPDEPTPFIGRAGEIGQIAAMLHDPQIRMVTLTGPGGTGKTRLALQVGATLLQDFSDGVFFVSLASLADPVLVPSAISDILKVKEEAGKSLVSTLIDWVRDKHLLLVLDNFEHLPDASAVVASLLDECRALHVLVTSRIPLHLSREHEYGVRPLHVPDFDDLPATDQLVTNESVALFIGRARAVKADFQITRENAPAVAEMCCRLDGLPLAIELAAARIKVFPPRVLLERLSSGLGLLVGGAKDRPARQQTLRNTIDWSYSLLTEEEQILFARISVFAGGCTVEAAEAVCDLDGDLDVLEGLASLVDKNLLWQGGEGEPRFQMLETVREYAAEKLDARAEAEAVRGTHARFFLTLTEEARPELTGPLQGKWLERLDGELDNLRAGMQSFLAQGEIAQELRLATALERFWSCRGYGHEGRRWLEKGLTAPAELVSPGIRARALQSMGWLAQSLGDYGYASTVLEDALLQFRELNDPQGSARALSNLGVVAAAQGEYLRATALFEESLQVAQEIGDQERSASALSNLAYVAVRQGDVVTAKKRYKEALPILRVLRDASSLALALLGLAEIADSEGNVTEAEARCKESLALARDHGLKSQLAGALAFLGHILTIQKRFERAGEILDESLRMTREIGEPAMADICLQAMAHLAADAGDARRAVRLHAAELAHRAILGMPLPPSEQALTEEMLAQVREALGEEEFASAWEAGHAMSLEEVMGYALGESE